MRCRLSLRGPVELFIPYYFPSLSSYHGGREGGNGGWGGFGAGKGSKKKVVELKGDVKHPTSEGKERTGKTNWMHGSLYGVPVTLQ